MSLTAFASGTFTPTSQSIASSTNASPISVHIVGHGLTTGDLVYIANHATNTGANGLWTIIVTGSDDFTLTGSVGVGVGGATGTVLSANESFVSNVNVAGTFYFVVDTINLAAGDALGVRIYQMVLTGGTARVVAFSGYSGAQPSHDVIKHSVAFVNELTDTNSLRLSLRQLLGVQRSFPWKILKADDPATVVASSVTGAVGSVTGAVGSVTGNVGGNVVGSVASVTAAVTLANPQGVRKNTALANFEFPMYDSAGNLASGLTFSAKQESIDGAALASLSGSISEIGSSGVYKISLTSGELNGDVITLLFTATGARTQPITIKTVQV